jgi:hypothetical protein
MPKLLSVTGVLLLQEFFWRAILLIASHLLVDLE